jgi:hypothetical protein
MKKLFLTGAVFCFLLLSSCDGEATGSQTAYNFGIYREYGFSVTAFAQVERYLKTELGLPWGTKFYAGENIADTNRQAENDFNKAAEKISVTKLNEIASDSASYTFTYAVYVSNDNTKAIASRTYGSFRW